MSRWTWILTVCSIVLGSIAGSARGDDEVTTLKKKIDQLRSELKDAHRMIETLREENEELREGKKLGTSPRKANEKDGFTKNSTFSGRRTLGKVEHHLTLVITERSGTSFVGTITIDHKPTNQVLDVEVRGVAAVGNGSVRFTTKKVGKFQQTFAGKYNNGEFSFDCGGTSRVGDLVRGRGYLTRE